MSRVGNLPVQIPSGVTVSLNNNLVEATGPLGKLNVQLRPEITIEQVGETLVLKRKKEDRISRSLHGLSRSLVYNLVEGVAKGWEKRLELVGVGYRVQSSGDKLNLSVGYSHPVEIVAPEGIKFIVEENTKIVVLGIDKNLVGQIASTIKKVRKPEPYQGKGIRYAGERVRRKPGKAGKAGVK